MNKGEYALDTMLCPGVMVNESDEYITFLYTHYNAYKELNVDNMHSVFERIGHKCSSTYWVCIHVYITGYDKLTGEEYCINNSSLDIPYKNVSAKKISKCFHSICYTLAPEPEPFEDTFDAINIRKRDYFSQYYSSGVIRYMKIVMKRTKPNKNPNRKTLSGRTRINVLERDDYTCQMCGATLEDGVKLHIDHIIPVSKGGGNDMDNLQVLCHKCNLAKHNRVDLKATREKLGGV